MTQSATILGCEGSRLGTDEAAFFREADPWGFILFARNVETPDQLRRLTGDLRAAVGREAPILVDQEGGRVQRLGAPHWREWLPPLDQVARTAPEAMERGLYLRYRLIAAELRAVGIDANCAPTADIAGQDTHPFLKNRCFGADAATVTRAARASAEGLLQGGVLPVMKHLPGHGRAVVDSHLQLPRVGAALGDLDATDFAPFRALADLPMAMTAHIVFDAVDAERPATASAAAIALIRDRIGFGGLLMTDDLSMEALSGTLGERAAAGIAAGCDIALYCKGIRAEAEAVVVASGHLSGAAAARAEQALACRRPPDAIDTALLEAELEALLMGRVHG
ncbi:beta-hexosaminidase [Defluviimonas sp. WL0024]|uniref:beta-N-acetylhexosaminidase n=1 Tax=Albidovulum salinarum TaxID=2984153 RepID=A0ABT2X3H3_9RHOB|nr:glycoside hydrolase family 3 N-terminal domain-containing protein [Defluviimonas sp. WL0024]MCU9846400.1 beta-hexosaminidase [Defluviimonas sp. WL0024]